MSCINMSVRQAYALAIVIGALGIFIGADGRYHNPIIFSTQVTMVVAQVLLLRYAMTQDKNE